MIKKSLLIIILILSFIISCSDSNSNNNTDNLQQTNSESNDDGITSDLIKVETPDIPETVDFDGHEFVILITGN